MDIARGLASRKYPSVFQSSSVAVLFVAILLQQLVLPILLSLLDRGLVLESIARLFPLLGRTVLLNPGI